MDGLAGGLALIAALGMAGSLKIEEKEQIFKEGNVRHFDGDAAFSKEAIELKIQLENLLKIQSRLNYRKKKLEKSLVNSDSISEEELNELSLFFPEANIKQLIEINKFHQEIIIIVTNEIKTELESIKSELKLLESKIRLSNNTKRIWKLKTVLGKQKTI